MGGWGAHSNDAAVFNDDDEDGVRARAELIHLGGARGALRREAGLGFMGGALR